MSYLSSTRAALSVTFVLLLGPTEPLAGEGRPLQVGDYIRGEVRDSSRNTKSIEGTLSALDDSTLTVDTRSWNDFLPLSYERKHVERLELRTRPSSNGKGALIGLGVGLVMGAIIGYAAGDHDESSDQWMDFHPPDEQTAVAGAVLLGAIGALAGSLIAPGATWEPVHSGKTTLGVVSPSSADAGVALKFSF